jgi:hypothetical protein
MPLRLILRVQGRGGAVSLYEHKGLGLLEVTELRTAAGVAPVLEVERHPLGLLRPLLHYARARAVDAEGPASNAEGQPEAHGGRRIMNWHCGSPPA